MLKRFDEISRTYFHRELGFNKQITEAEFEVFIMSYDF